MRIRVVYITLIAIVLPFLSKGQTFQNEYFNEDYAHYTSLSTALLRPDGVLLCTVFNKDYSQYNYAAGIASFYGNGSPIWIVGDSVKNLFFSGMVLLPDKGFIATSNRQISTQIFDEGIVSRFDAFGNMVWNKQLPLVNNNLSNNLSIAGRQSIYLVGNTFKSVYVSKINASGTANWEKEIPIDSTHDATSTELDNGNLLFGFKSDIKSDHHGHLIEVNPGGDVVRAMSFEDRTIGQIMGLHNGNIIMVSRSNLKDSTGESWVSMLDPQLAPLWSRKIEIPGWNINNIIVTPNLQQDSLSLLFNNSYDAELGILTVGLDGALHTAKARFGTWVEAAIRMPDDGLLLAGAKLFESFRRSVLVKTDVEYNVAGCEAVNLCNVAYTAENLVFTPENIVLNNTTQLIPIQLAVQKLNWSTLNYCGNPPDTVALFTGLDSIICAGSKTQFLAHAGGNGFWKFENGRPDYQNSGKTGTTQFDAPGQFTVTHTTTEAGCFKATAKQIVQVLPQPKLVLPGANTICVGDSIVVEPEITEPNVQYKWNDGLTTPQRKLAKAGAYILEAINLKGCKTRDTTILKTTPIPAVQIEGLVEACNGQTIVLQAVADRPGLQYKWNTGFENAALPVQVSGLYTVQVNDGPCMAQDTMRVAFNECCNLFIPNVFAPGSGGDNAIWALQSTCGFVQYQVEIFDRWGNLVFQSSDPNRSWDGMYKGNLLPNGVYVCNLDAETENDGKRTRIRRVFDVAIVR
ncbi:MAG: gliding motility-associated C-terminal domain-containing protein [Bacteroidota bacterium]